MAIDKVLRKPIEAGLIPGVVALAGDDRGVIYEGAFGQRAVDKTDAMTLDSGFSHRVYDQGRHRHSGHAAS